MTRRSQIVLLAVALLLPFHVSAAQSTPLRNTGVTVTAPARARATIVLVHGAFADATGFKNLIPLLEADGHYVIAVQNPLSSLAADVANTRRVIDAQTGPVVVLGHSYGGAVMTEAAAGRPNVKALVYVAAFAPDAGESGGAMLAKGPASMLSTALAPDAGGYVYIDRAKFREVFAGDVSAAEANIMAVTQKPVFGHIFEEAPSAAAWKSIPSWYVVSQNDHVIHPDLQRLLAKRMKATTSEARASHVAFITQPQVIAKVVKDAVSATVK